MNPSPYLAAVAGGALCALPVLLLAAALKVLAAWCAQ
jgi:hypothetical protein